MISTYPIPPHPVNMFEHYQPSILTPPNCREIAIWPNRLFNFQAMNLKTESRHFFLNQKLNEQSSFDSEYSIYLFILCACPHVCMEEWGTWNLSREDRGNALITFRGVPWAWVQAWLQTPLSTEPYWRSEVILNLSIYCSSSIHCELSPCLYGSFFGMFILEGERLKLILMQTQHIYCLRI